MARSNAVERNVAASSRTRADDDRALRRLRHHDAKGLLLLMDDYQALGDELEVVECARPTDPSPPPTRRRAA